MVLSLLQDSPQVTLPDVRGNILFSNLRSTFNVKNAERRGDTSQLFRATRALSM